MQRQYLAPKNIRLKGDKVYKKDECYYHRDTLHKGDSAYLGVYNKKGKYKCEADLYW